MIHLLNMFLSLSCNNFPVLRINFKYTVYDARVSKLKYLVFKFFKGIYFIGGAIAQSVERWSRNQVTWVRNQVDALVPFGKELILITRSLGEDLVAYLQAFMLS